MNDLDDLSPLFEHGEVELGSLSDEEHDVLWLGERIDENPLHAPILVVALRSLLATGRAWYEGDDLIFDPALAVIKQCYDLADVVVEGESADGTEFTWIPHEASALLERRRSPYGVSHFVLRPRAEAVTSLVAQLVGDTTLGAYVDESGPVRELRVHPEGPGFVLSSDEASASQTVDRVVLRRLVGELLDITPAN